MKIKILAGVLVIGFTMAALTLIDFLEEAYAPSQESLLVINNSKNNGALQKKVASEYFFSKTEYVSNTQANPDLTINNNIGGSSGYNIETQNGIKTFLRCTSNLSFSGIFEFEDPDAASYPAGTTFSLDWGDGTTSTQVENHTYDAGLYTLIYSVTLPGGSVNTSEFRVFVGTEPQPISIELTGNTSCIPEVYEFTFSSQGHTPGTTYTIDINDGSDPIILDTSSLTVGEPFELILNHQFIANSCGVRTEIGNTLYDNAFSISVTASNPCATEGNFISAGPIRVSEATDTDFIKPADVACVDTVVIFNDISDSGTNTSASNCSEEYGRYWEISPATGFTVAGGSQLGNDAGFPEDWTSWTDGSENLGIIFDEPGDYLITLVTRNSCGESRETKDICIIEVSSQFNIAGTTEACFDEDGLLVSTENNSQTESCDEGPIYEWSVDAVNPDCPSAETEWEFANGTTSSDFEPDFRFLTPGVYTIILTVSLEDILEGDGCFSDITQQVVTIKDRPKAELEDLIVCQNEPFLINPTVYDCYANDATTYSWDFGSTPPASISNSNDPNPEISYDTPGDYTYELTLSNECGTSTFTGNLEVLPAVEIEANGPSESCVNNPIDLLGTITGGNGNVTWSADVEGGTFEPDINDLNPTYTPPDGYNGDITFTISFDNTGTLCDIKSDTHTVTIDGPEVDAGTYNPVCLGDTLALNGSVEGSASIIQWSSSDGGTFDDETDLTTNFTPASGFLGTLTLTLSVETNDSSTSCAVNTDTVEIEIIPSGEIDATPLNDLQFCNAEETSEIVFNSPNGSSFRWEIDEDIGLTPTSGTGNLPGFTTLNSTEDPIVATVTVTPFLSSNGTECDGTPETFNITVQPVPNLAGLETLEDYTLEDISCFGESDGAINLSNDAEAFFDDPSYAFEWSGPNGFSSSEPNLNNLQAGNYSLEVTELSSSLNCSAILLEITIEEPQPLEINNIVSSQAFCFGVNDGSISFLVQGGTPPYTSNYGDVDMNSGLLIENLSPGTYSIEVTDANGCETSVDIEVEEGFVNDIAPPTGESFQEFCEGSQSTVRVSNLDVNGMDIKWYLSPSDNEPLPDNYLIRESTVLYARNFDPDLECLSSETLEVEVSIIINDTDVTEINNYISVNENNLNDNLNVVNIEVFPDNEMKIFNRYGKLVWETTGYDNADNTFRGAANVGGTLSKGEFLPTGTYYYILKYNSTCRKGTRKGFIQIDNNR